MAGKVYFVGAGPGDPELITVKGQRLLGAADLVVWTDSLVSPELLQWVRADARVLGSSAMDLNAIMAELIPAAQAGQTVVRLHTGDPAMYGAILEQMVRLNAAGVSYEVVPGVSSVFAAAAALGAELTVPELAQTVILTRLEGRTPVPELEQLRLLAAHRTTLVLYLSAGMMQRVAAELQVGGYPPDTPVAVVRRASWPDQQVLRGTLADIAATAAAAGIRNHALILVGPALDPTLPTAGPPGNSRLYDRDFAHGRRRAAGPNREG